MCYGDGEKGRDGGERIDDHEELDDEYYQLFEETGRALCHQLFLRQEKLSTKTGIYKGLVRMTESLPCEQPASRRQRLDDFLMQLSRVQWL
uniref:Uncharacterized protein n=1 Tax=Citrifermentans bremense TaxID=60035 RepID=A0A6S6LW32_9BACT